MAVVSKKTKPVSAPVEEKKTAPAVKKTTEKVASEVKKTDAPKKISLTGNTKSPKSFEIKEGAQATQEAFIDRFYKKLCALGYDVTKEQTKAIKKAYSETLADVTNIASYQDVDAGMYYARRYIKSRVTEPPKAKDGLKTLMMGHYEIKVRKLIGNDEEFKFFGDLNEDGTIFITTDGEEIPVSDEVEVKPTTKKVVKATKKAPIVEEVEEEDIIEEDDDSEFDDFLEDDDE